MGHDAISVLEVEPAGAEDSAVFDVAVAQQRIVVTENVADFAALPGRSGICLRRELGRRLG